MESGRIKFFNGKFGFIKCLIGDFFFSKDELLSPQVFKNDQVQFRIGPSRKKKDELQAYQVSVIKSSVEEIITKENKVGKIAWISHEKGFGAIQKREREEIFLHHSNVLGSFDSLQEGETVIYQKGRNNNGPIATNVLKLSSEIVTSFLKVQKSFPVENEEFYFEFMSRGFVCSYITKDIIDFFERRLSHPSNRFSHFKQSDKFDTTVTASLRTLNSVEDQILFIEECIIPRMDSLSGIEYSNFRHLGLSKYLMDEAKEFLISAFATIKEKDLKAKLWLDGLYETEDLDQVVKFLLDQNFDDDSIVLDRLGRYQNKMQDAALKLADAIFRYCFEYASEFSIFGEQPFSKASKLMTLILENLEFDQRKFDELVKVYREENPKLIAKLWSQGLIKDIEVDILYLILFKAHGEGLIFTPSTNNDYPISTLEMGFVRFIDLDKSENPNLLYRFFQFMVAKFEFTPKGLKNIIVTLFHKLSNEYRLEMYLDQYVSVYNLEDIANRIGDEVGREEFAFSFKKMTQGLSESDLGNLNKSLINMLGPVKGEVECQNITAIIESFNGLNQEKVSALRQVSQLTRDFRLLQKYSAKALNMDHFDHERFQAFAHKSNAYIKMSAFHKLTFPLLVIDQHYYHEGEKFIEIFLNSPEYIMSTNSKYRVNSTFFVEGVNLNPEHFQAKVEFAKAFHAHIEENKDNFLTDIIEELSNCSSDFYFRLDQLLKFERNFNTLNSYLKLHKTLFITDILSDKTSKIPLYRLILIQNYLEENIGKSFETDDQHLLTPKILGLKELIHSRLEQGIQIFEPCNYPINLSAELVVKAIITWDHEGSTLNGEQQKKKSIKVAFINQMSSLSYIQVIEIAYFFAKHLSEDKCEKDWSSYYKSLLIRISSFLETHLEGREIEITEVIREMSILKKARLIKQIQSLLNEEFANDFCILEELLKRIRVSQDYGPAEITSPRQMIKLWAYDKIETFDFQTYSHYYFALNKFERRIFNKRVRAKMGEELKVSMLKKRVPWQFIGSSKGRDEQLVYRYLASWKSVSFHEKHISFCIDKDGNYSELFPCDFAEEKFNLLFDYLTGKRSVELVITCANNKIIEVLGLDILHELIWKAELHHYVNQGGASDTLKAVGSNRIPVNIIMRNECLVFLNKLQVNNLKPTRILEFSHNQQGSISADVSLLYSIPHGKEEVAVIWESLELNKAKATHIFRCNLDDYNSVFQDITAHLQKEIKVRSGLNSNESDAIEKQKSLKYYCRVDHYNQQVEKWKDMILEALPLLG